MDTNKILNTVRAEPIVNNNTFPKYYDSAIKENAENGCAFSVGFFDNVTQVGVRLFIMGIDLDSNKEKYVFEVENRFNFSSLLANEEEIVRYIYNELYTLSIVETNRLFKLINTSYETLECLIYPYEEISQRIRLGMIVNPLS